MRGGKIFGTIRGRIVVLYTLLFALAFFFVFLTVNQLVGNFLISQRTTTQSEQVENVAARLASYTANRDASDLYVQSVSAAQELGGRILVLDMDGIVLCDTHAELNGRLLRHPEVEDVRQGKTNASYGYHRVNTGNPSLLGIGKTWVVYYTASIVHQSREVGILLVSLPMQDVVDLTHSVMTKFTVVSVCILVILVVASIFISRWISMPITQMTSAIRRMSHGDFEARVRVTGASEIAEMGRTFNRMSEQLASIDRQRSEFVSNASHELKTPMSAIKILTESLLYQENVPEEMYKEFLNDINEQIDRSNSLLSDLLELAQTERSSVAMRYTNQPVSDIIEEAVKTLQPIADEKGVALIVLPTVIRLQCDRIKMTTALINLISNGIKYTPQGGSVTISVDVQEQWVAIHVADTGIGIPKDDQAKIFERFYRVDKARSRETGGTGLGLSIVQQICRLHGGDIMLESEENKGSIFTMRVPQWGLEG